MTALTFPPSPASHSKKATPVPSTPTKVSPTAKENVSPYATSFSPKRSIFLSPSDPQTPFKLTLNESKDTSVARVLAYTDDASINKTALLNPFLYHEESRASQGQEEKTLIGKSGRSRTVLFSTLKLASARSLPLHRKPRRSITLSASKRQGTGVWIRSKEGEDGECPSSPTRNRGKVRAERSRQFTFPSTNASMSSTEKLGLGLEAPFEFGQASVVDGDDISEDEEVASFLLPSRLSTPFTTVRASSPASSSSSNPSTPSLTVSTDKPHLTFPFVESPAPLKGILRRPPPGQSPRAFMVSKTWEGTLMNGGKRDRILESLDVVVEVKRRRLEEGKWKVIGRLVGDDEDGRRVEDSSAVSSDNSPDTGGQAASNQPTSPQNKLKANNAKFTSPPDEDDMDEPDEDDQDGAELLTILRSALQTLSSSDIQGYRSPQSSSTIIFPRALPLNDTNIAETKEINTEHLPITLLEVEQAYRQLIRRLWTCAALVKQAQNMKKDGNGEFWKGKEKLLKEIRSYSKSLARCILRELHNVVNPPKEEYETLADEDAELEDERIFIGVEKSDGLHSSPLKVKPEAIPKIKRIGSSAFAVRRISEETRAAMSAIKCLGCLLYEGELWKMWDEKDINLLLDSVCTLAEAEHLRVKSRKEILAYPAWLFYSQQLPQNIIIPYLPRIASAFSLAIQCTVPAGKKSARIYSETLQAILVFARDYPVQFLPTYQHWLCSGILEGLVHNVATIRSKSMNALALICHGLVLPWSENEENRYILQEQVASAVLAHWTSKSSTRNDITRLEMLYEVFENQRERMDGLALSLMGLVPLLLAPEGLKLISTGKSCLKVWSFMMESFKQDKIITNRVMSHRVWNHLIYGILLKSITTLSRTRQLRAFDTAPFDTVNQFFKSIQSWPDKIDKKSHQPNLFQLQSTVKVMAGFIYGYSGTVQQLPFLVPDSDQIDLDINCQISDRHTAYFDKIWLSVIADNFPRMFRVPYGFVKKSTFDMLCSILTQHQGARPAWNLSNLICRTFLEGSLLHIGQKGVPEQLAKDAWVSSVNGVDVPPFDLRWILKRMDWILDLFRSTLHCADLTANDKDCEWVTADKKPFVLKSVDNLWRAILHNITLAKQYKHMAQEVDAAVETVSRLLIDLLTGLKRTTPMIAGLVRSERRKVEFHIIDLLFGVVVDELREGYYGRAQGGRGDFANFITALFNLQEKDHSNMGFRELFLTVSHFMDCTESYPFLEQATRQFYLLDWKLEEKTSMWSLLLYGWRDIVEGEFFFTQERPTQVLEILTWGTKNVDLDRLSDDDDIHKMKELVSTLISSLADAGYLDQMLQRVCSSSSYTTFFLRACLEVATSKNVCLDPQKVVGAIQDVRTEILAEQQDRWWLNFQGLLSSAVIALGNLDSSSQKAVFETLSPMIIEVLQCPIDLSKPEEYSGYNDLYRSTCQFLEHFITIDTACLLDCIPVISAPFPDLSTEVWNVSAIRIFYDFWQRTFSALQEISSCPDTFLALLLGIKSLDSTFKVNIPSNLLNQPSQSSFVTATTYSQFMYAAAQALPAKVHPQSSIDTDPTAIQQEGDVSDFITTPALPSPELGNYIPSPSLSSIIPFPCRQPELDEAEVPVIAASRHTESSAEIDVVPETPQGSISDLEAQSSVRKRKRVNGSHGGATKSRRLSKPRYEI